MRLKGLEKVREKVPGYPGRRILLFPLCGLVSFSVGLLFLFLIDILPEIFPAPLLVTIEPVLPVLGTSLLLALSIGTVASLWHNREQYRARYGILCYQHAIKRGIVAVTLIPAAITHAFFPLGLFPYSSPANPLTGMFAQPLLGPWSPIEIDFLVRLLISVALLLTAVATALRAVLTFGIDYMVIVYLFFPEESDLCDHDIYSTIRHPAYFSIVLISLSAAFLHLSVYSISIAALIIIALRVHIRNEESELIERFGDSYRDYMRRVPAMHIRLHDLPVFIRFLRGATTSSRNDESQKPRSRQA